MRDGIILSADLYQPDQPGQPTILIRTPYGRRMPFALSAQLFAERGYQVLVQSCRGTGGSDGVLSPFLQEHADGLDTVEWLERQPWFAGRLATYGASYLGYVQWAIAAELGERLSAMAVAMSLSNFSEEIRQGGGFTLAGMLGWTSLMDALRRQNLAGMLLRRALGRGGLPRRVFEQLPLAELDVAATGRTIAYWRQWVGQDSPHTGIWECIDRRASLGRVTAPVTMVAGWSDIFLPAQLRDFAMLRAHGRDVRILIGPWGHTDAIGKAPILDALEWFDHHLKGRPLVRRTRVRYQLEGEGGWHEAEQWPAAAGSPWALHLAADGWLRDGPDAQTETGTTNTDTFVYDPADPTPSIAGPALDGGKGHRSLQALAGRKDVRSYDSAPLPAALQLIGPVSAELIVSADVPTHDLFVCVCEVGGNGVPIHISDGYIRLVQPAPAEQPRSVRIDCWPIARRVAAGQRLRLFVAGGAHPRYARNLGFDGSFGAMTAMRTARIRIHRPGSRLILPLLQGALP
jgi:putative CocE/NonD family hydrolase